MAVGTQMVLRLIDKLSQQRRQEIMLDLRESNLEAQLFFRKQGFRAVRIVRGHYDDTSEDAYIMQFKLDQLLDDAASFVPHNRISEIDAA
jgi:ribosomal-protein-alanine N-acetyltransferase